MELLCAIYKILKEESNEEETLARSAIERKLKEKYSDVKTGHKMVRDRLNAICNFEMNLPDDQKTIRYKEGEYIKNKGYRGSRKRYLIKMNMKKDGIILKKQILKLIIF